MTNNESLSHPKMFPQIPTIHGAGVTRSASPEMKCQPECVLGNRLNAVPQVRGNEEVVAGLEIECFPIAE
jgi:hypothetical protein